MAPNGIAEVHDLDAERLPFLPKSVLSDILGLLLPGDLVSLAATCSTLRNFLLLPSSTSIWSRAHANKAQEQQEAEQRPEHLNLVLLREKYYELIDAGYLAHRDEFPSFAELSALRGARIRLANASSREDVEQIATWLVKAVNSWRSKAYESTQALQPQWNVSLKSARSVFRRGTEPRCLVYPDMFLDGATYSIADPTRALPGPDDGLRFDTRGSQIVRRLCELAGLGNGMSTTQTQLDASRIRFCCLSCEPERPLVLNWRQAIEHANAEHDGIAEPEWARWPPSTAERAVMADGSLEAWICLKCPSARLGKLSRPAARHHISEVHEMAQPVEGTHFARCTRTKWPPPPQNVLALHAEEVPCTVLDDDDAEQDRDVLWKCRHCTASAGVLFEGANALPRLERHLRETHHVSLVPEQRHQKDAAAQVQVGFATLNGPLANGPFVPMVAPPMIPVHALPPPLLNPAQFDYMPPTTPFPVPANGPTPGASTSKPPTVTVAQVQPIQTFVPPTASKAKKQPASATLQVQPIPKAKALAAVITKPPPAPASQAPKEVFRVWLPGGVRGVVHLGHHNDEKVFGCRHCAGDAKQAERRFALNGIKMHLASKHRKPEPVLEQDFYHQGGLSAVRGIEIQQTT